MVIESGSKESFNIIHEDHEKNISEIASKHNIALANSNKIFFLMQLGVSENSFENGYQFLNEYFEDNTKFYKNNSFEDFFRKNSNY